MSFHDFLVSHRESHEWVESHVQLWGAIYSYTDCNCNFHSNIYANGDRDWHANIDPICHANCESDCNCHSHRFKQSDAYAQTDAYCQAAYNTEAAADSAAKAVGRANNWGAQAWRVLE